MKIETKRLLIRNFRADDWNALREMIIQKESSEYAEYDHEWPTSEKEIKKITEWFASGDMFHAVCLKETDKLIGFIALDSVKKKENNEFNLGFYFDSNYHGKGYATEGCKAILHYAFSELKAEKVTSGTAAANHPARNLLTRLGMRKTGEDITSFRKTPEGKPIEFVGLRFSISKNEWCKLNT
jgi:RimJ/RimL family protein N-acetyltransferase